MDARSGLVQSILAVDCGTLYTRAVLIDVVGDEYRFVGSAASPTTAERPFGDITIGVNSAITELENTTGRQFVIDGRIITPQRSDGHGVDLLVASCSAAPALRLVVAGLTREFSTSAASNAARTTYSDVLECISLDDQPPANPNETDRAPLPEGWWTETQAQKLLALSPDAVLVAGGVEDGPVAPLLRLANLLLRTFAEQRTLANAPRGAVADADDTTPVVLFAGNSAVLEPLQQTLGDLAEVVALPNLQPDLRRIDTGPLERALREQYERRQLPQLPGYEALGTWSRTALQPTLHAVELMARYIAAQYRREVLVADVGAGNIGLIYAGNTDHGDHATVIRGNYGLAQGLANLLAAVGPEAVLRWLPFPFSAEELGNWALNKVLRPLTLPQTARDLAIEHAFAREALRSSLAEMKSRPDLAALSYDLLVGTGGLLSSAPRTGQAALVLLDGLEPTGEGVGSFELALDSTLLLPALGSLAQAHPGAAAYVFDRDCLFMLGPCIVPLGVGAAPARGNGRKPAKNGASAAPDTAASAPIAVEITVDIAGRESQRYEVPYGTIQVIPLRPDERASLRVKPGSNFRIGRDEPGKVVQTRPGEEVKGGLIGLIVDARGRPLALPQDDAARIARLLEWNRALRAYSPRETFEAIPAAQPAMPPARPQQIAVPPRAATTAVPAQPAAQPQAAAEPPRPAAPLPTGLESQTAPASGSEAPPAAPRKRQTAPLIWPTEEPPSAGAGPNPANPPHLSTGRRPGTGALSWPGDETGRET